MIIGKISRNIGFLSGKLTPEKKLLKGKLQKNTDTLSGGITHPTVTDIDAYSGEYVVDPDAAGDVILLTKRKTLFDDITVNKIKYIETTNPSGGQTVYIG